YPQRFGHEFNLLVEHTPDAGMSVKERTLADYLSERGYQTMAIGKWHLGYRPRFHPLRRGFDEFYGFLEGWRSYWPGETAAVRQLLHNDSPADETFEYLTDELGKAAVEFIAADRQQPYFLYLAFTAPHTPCEAKPDKLSAASHIPNESRRTLAAMLSSLDDAVGDVLAAIDATDAGQNTIVAFVNDNGGPEENASDNAPLRGHKGSLYEGGVRVPFLLSWPSRWPSDAAYDQPVSALDLAPTMLAAVDPEAGLPPALDGVDLTPYLTGQRDRRPHQTLCWRRGAGWAIRHNDWKLISPRNGVVELYSLAQDPSESASLALAEPQRVRKLRRLYDDWATGMSPPAWRVPWQ
ncbi:MAG: sulfatase-like hydrolase/transferase, partial [Planctomycetales bacterium]|nr:sulfatase-like hydrolase/transferase [Planctomycetales bacterium]